MVQIPDQNQGNQNLNTSLSLQSQRRLVFQDCPIEGESGMFFGVQGDFLEKVSVIVCDSHSMHEKGPEVR
jgi:hypothetical protein